MASKIDGLNRYAPEIARFEGGSCGFSMTSSILTIDDPGDAKACRVGDFDQGNRGFGTGSREIANQVFHLILEDVVAEQHAERFFADKGMAQIDGVRQPKLFFLDDVVEFDPELGAIAELVRESASPGR